MNIAFTTLIILLLLLPGIFFSRFYYSGEFSKQYFKPNLFELVLSTLIQSIFLHTLWVGICYYSGYTFNYYILISLLSGIEDTDHLKEVSDFVKMNIGEIVLYNFSLWGVALGLGQLTRLVVRKVKLDRKFTILRFQNEWHYILSGEMLDFPNVEGQARKIDAIALDVLVDSADGVILYSGILQNYVLSRLGGLELINMREVTRKFIKLDTKKPNIEVPNYELVGNTFSIPYSKVQNIHIMYVDIDLMTESLEVHEGD